MSNDNSFRELKFSPSQLVIVFLAILVLGVFVFLLGISVGKKQTQVLAQAGSAARPSVETLSEPIKVGEFVTTTAPAVTKAETGEAAAPESKTGSAVEAKNKPTETKPAETKPVETKNAPKPAAAEAKPKPAAPAYTSAPYYIQIGAVANRAAAEAYAKRVGGLGFPTLVLNPLASDSKPTFRIRVGPYPSKDEAADAQGKLATALKKKRTDFFLVKS
jgi:cell division protein FtsN